MILFYAIKLQYLIWSRFKTDWEKRRVAYFFFFILALYLIFLIKTKRLQVYIYIKKQLLQVQIL